MIRTLLAGAAVCFMALATPGAAQVRRFSADDLPRMVRIADP